MGEGSSMRVRVAWCTMAAALAFGERDAMAQVDAGRPATRAAPNSAARPTAGTAARPAPNSAAHPAASTARPATNSAAHPAASAARPATNNPARAGTNNAAHPAPRSGPPAANIAAPPATTAVVARPRATTVSTAQTNAPVAARSPAPAAAEPAATPAPTSAVASQTPPIDNSELIHRIEAAAVRPSAEAARTISQIILRGPAPEVIVAGLNALGVVGRPEGAAAVARFLRHRRPAIRRQAIAAARTVHTPSVIEALADLLGDPDEAVRRDAAVALAEIGNRSVVQQVLEAFERDLEDATGPQGGPLTQPCALGIGKFGGADDITRLMAFLGRAPLQALTDAARPALRRSDLPEAFRVDLVNSIGRLATRDVRNFLNAVIAEAAAPDNAIARTARDAAARIAE